MVNDRLRSTVLLTFLAILLTAGNQLARSRFPLRHLGDVVMRQSALLTARNAHPVRRPAEGSGLFGLFGIIAAVTLLMLGIHVWRDVGPVLEGPSVNAARTAPVGVPTQAPRAP